MREFWKLFIGAFGAAGFVFWWGIVNGSLSVLATTHGLMYWILVVLFVAGFAIFGVITGIIGGCWLLLCQPKRVSAPCYIVAAVFMALAYWKSHQELGIFHLLLATAGAVGLTGSAWILLGSIWPDRLEFPEIN